MTPARRLLVACLLAMLGTGASAAERPRIAIIIDDLGYEPDAGRRAIALPGPVSCAILPLAPRSRALALAANANGKEVLLHLPMQANGDDGRGAPVDVTLDMSERSFAEKFDAAFDSVPHASGVNNHRGSLITRHPGHMRWLMDKIRERGVNVFFVDSYTTHLSVALDIAAEAGVRAVKRDVFLDADRTPAGIRREFERLKTLARRHGAAVAIGHPYEETLAFLEQALPELAVEGFELVPVGELVENLQAGTHSNAAVPEVSGPHRPAGALAQEPQP